MQVLLDNCVPVRLGRLIAGHKVENVVTLGWAAFPDKALLEAMTGKFEVLVSVDKSLPFQQNLVGRTFGVVILRARSNRLADLTPLVPDLLRELQSLSPGDLRLIGL